MVPSNPKGLIGNLDTIKTIRRRHISPLLHDLLIISSMSAPPSSALMPPQFHSPSPYSSPSSSIITVIIIVASAVTASATIYLLLRFLSNRLFHGRSFSAAADDVVSQSGGASSHRACCHVASRGLIDSLPLFSFRSVTGNIAGGGYCAVCLSKFEPDDRLRLLPLCCHVFHADCIDAWIASNQTCPLCRSTVLPCSSDALDKILFLNNSVAVSGGSFRIEIGSISRRGDAGGGARRCYSLGSFEYIVDENECQVPADCTTHRRGVSDEVKLEIQTAEALAAEVSGGRNWLREYVDKISCRATSFRSSGRMFAGSISCRSEAVIVPEEMEVNRIGEEFG